jgi:glycosyltransferase involved in cell wall biosynthesis
MIKIDIPLVSVIIPCYNASKFLNETITSILDQTYTNIEIIIVDDGSTDNIAQVIEGFCSKVIYKRQNNSGVSVARNEGYLISNGEYICFVDADDWLYPETVSEKVNLLQNNSSFGIAYGWVMVADRNLKDTGEILKGKAGKDVIESLLNFESPIPCPSNVLFRRDTIEKVGLFDPHLSMSADFDMWLRVCLKYETGMINKLSVKYRIHSNNMSRNTISLKNDMEFIIKKYEVNRTFENSMWNKTKQKLYYIVAVYYFKKFNIAFVKYLFLYCKYLGKSKNLISHLLY